MKHLHEGFTEAEYAALKEQKGERRWRTAVLDEFGIGEGDRDD